MKRYINLDQVSTTKVSSTVLKAMLPYYSYVYGNTTSPSYFGKQSKKAVEKSREIIADWINADTNEIVFTSGATEANNLAVKGVARAQKRKGKNHIIISNLEHPSIFEPVQYLEKYEGFKVTKLPCSNFGITDLNALKNAVTPQTAIISIIYANNAIGTIQPVTEAVKIAKEKNIVIHTDAVHIASLFDVNLKELDVDLLTFTSHKFHGDKCCGILYVKNGVEIDSIIHGDNQNFGLRGGTMNVPSIVGMTTAFDIACSNMDNIYSKLSTLQYHFINRIENEITSAIFNGDKNNCVPQIANFSFVGIGSDIMLKELDKSGISCSNKYNYMLKPLGLSEDRINSAVRFSFSKYTTFEELDYTINVIKNITRR